MSQKVLRTSTDYRIESAGNVYISSSLGGTITIDTGSLGTTYVTGNLTVQGTTTTVDSTIVTVKDNIIILNYGETGAGVTTVISGIEIDRGSLEDAQVVWDESAQEWVFYSEKAPINTLSPIRAKSIELLNGVTIDNLDNDDTLSGNNSASLPTQYAVKTYVDTSISATANTIFEGDSSVTVHDTGMGGYVETILDGSVRSVIDGTSFNVDQISSYTADSNLTITANGTGEIIINKIVQMPYQISVPASSVNTNKLYAAAPGSGGTGLFFVNPSTSDELVSKTKAIVYGIIF